MFKNDIDENKSQQGKYLLHIIDREQYKVIIITTLYNGVTERRDTWRSR